MKYILLASIIFVFACNQQGMSDEHRQKIKEETADRKIKRITDADILNAAKARAEKLYKSIDTNKYNFSTSNEQIKWVSMKDTLTNVYEKNMQEAYQYSLDQGLELYDNIEEVENAIIVYTKPEVISDSLQGFWIISLDKKEVIRALK